MTSSVSGLLGEQVHVHKPSGTGQVETQGAGDMRQGPPLIDRRSLNFVSVRVTALERRP